MPQPVSSENPALRFALIGARSRGQNLSTLLLQNSPSQLVGVADPNPAALDIAYYNELLLRAAGTVLGPLGIEETTLHHWLFSRASYSVPPGQVPPEGLPLLIHRDTCQRQMPERQSPRPAMIHGS